MRNSWGWRIGYGGGRWDSGGSDGAPLSMPSVRRNEVAILWRVWWCGRDEMVNTLLQYSYPPLSPPLIFSLFLFLALRSVDYEDTSSSLTAWPLLHVLMRSAYLHCIINKSEKWLFLLLFFLTCSFYFFPSLQCLLSWGVSGKLEKKCVGPFPARLPCFTGLTKCAGSSPSNPLLHYLKGTQFFFFYNDIQFLPWHYLL